MVRMRTYRLRLVPVLLLILMGNVLTAPGCRATPPAPRPSDVPTVTPIVTPPPTETSEPTSRPSPTPSEVPGTPSPTPPAVGGVQLENGQQIVVTADERLFTLLCACNLGGYDAMAGNRMHPVRAEVREYLETLGPSLVRMVELNVGARNLGSRLSRIGSYFRYAFSLSAPPAFEELRPVPPIAPGFGAVMSRLYTRGRLDEIWEDHQSAYQEVVDGYRALAPAAVEEINAYLRVNEARLPRTVVIVPTLMLARGSGLNCVLDDTVYVVPGPTQRPSPVLLQHEYLHQVVGPMIDEHADLLSASEPLFELVGAEEEVFGDYGSWPLVVEESLLRAMPQRLPGNRDWDKVEAYIQRQEKIGLLLTGYFYEALEDYESQEEMSFEEYLPTLLEGIDVEREWETWEAME